MKKIISLIASLALLASASSVAFAFGEESKPEGFFEPKATISIVDSGEPKEEGYSLYNATIKLSDLGILTHEVGSLSRYSGSKLVQCEIYLESDNIITAGIGGNLGELSYYTGKDATIGAIGYTGFWGNFQLADVLKAYPQSPATDNKTPVSIDTSINPIEDAMTFSFYGIEGETVEVTKMIVGFSKFTNNNAGDLYSVDAATNKTVFVLGETAAAELELAVDLANKYDNGYVWAAEITKDDAVEISTFDAKFTAGAESTDRVIRNIDEFLSMFSGGKTTFNIGLETKKVLTGAEFTVTDSEGGSAYVDADVN